ncbi:MAG: 30S ribosomal protein S3ae [Euryarchaeota archaeon]|nr:30S ribosomal protein S3ae [Euryarchaeota archaeon]|tara:strand:+ start:12509 stop:13507 length:999 start_codon:yes stop_codon:yes gene_type:complete
MAKKLSAKARAAARKQRDKWKNKRWFTIRAPRHPWNFKRIGETIGETDEHIMGRVYEMTQQEFSGDFTKMHVLLRFRVTDVVGQDALTTFVGHSHQSDHTRRQIRRYRGKIDDVVDVVTTDGFLVRMKPLMITERRCQTSVKQAMRAKSADIIRAFASKSNYSKLQEAMLGGDLETEIRNAVKSIYPCRNVVIRKSQLLQTGVVSEKGPTLDEIHAEESRQEAELKAKKAAALEAAEEEENSGDGDLLAAAEAMESISEKEEVTETPSEEENVETSAEESEPEAEEATADEPSGESEASLMKLKKDELVERAKAAGVATSGTKADIVARLLE